MESPEAFGRREAGDYKPVSLEEMARRYQLVAV
jgi:hypothetical protein